MIQYMGGLNGLSNQLALIKGCSKEQADKESAAFMGHLKGKGGIAETTFAALKFLTTRQDLRTYLLGVKCPNTINFRYVPDERSFVTLRGNWPIQSAGVDEKHALIAILDLLIKKHGLNAQFACEIHDRVAYFCQEEQAVKMAELFDTAMGKLAELSLEQAAKFWDRFDPLLQPRPVLEPDPRWCKFEKVYISKTLVEA